MTPHMIHGRRHEVEFYSAPDGNALMAGVTEVLGGSGIAFRVVERSSDCTIYIIEEVDIGRTLRQHSIAPSEYTRTVPVNLTCTSCKTQYNVYEVVNRKFYDQRTHYEITKHCPACLEASPEVWLASLGYHTEAPTPVPAPAPSTSIDMADFD